MRDSHLYIHGEPVCALRGVHKAVKQVSLLGLGHKAFMLADNYPELRGLAGQIKIRGFTASGEDAPVSVVGLLANPYGPFTTLFPMLSLSELARGLE